MDKKIIKKRIKGILHNLAEKGIKSLIVTNPANVTYTTGFMGGDSWAIIAESGVYLLTDSRYAEQAQKECVGCKIILRPDSLPLAPALTEKLKQLKLSKKVAVEKSTSIADFESLKKNLKTRPVTVSSIIENARSIKDDSEIASIKTASRIAAKALKQTLGYIKPGITENELAGMLNFQFRKLGATNSFETIVAFGPNASRPHHQPSKRKLRKEDTVLIDFGAKYNGYCSDITRCFAVGGPTAFYKKAYDTVQKAQAAAIKLIKAGVETGKVDDAARDVFRKSGLPVYGHGTGHGLGLEIHELPYLKAKGRVILQPGQIITVEPGLYIPGRLGIRIEDDILVTETPRLRREASGCEILTRSCPHLLSLPNRRG